MWIKSTIGLLNTSQIVRLFVAQDSGSWYVKAGLAISTGINEYAISDAYTTEVDAREAMNAIAIGRPDY